MKTFKIKSGFFLAVFIAPSIIAQDAPRAPEASKVSYACGMNLGVQIKQMGADVDVDAITRAIRDVQEGKQTQLQTSELPAIFKQEEDFARAQTAAKDKAEGSAFLAKNATQPGIVVLPDGLQYSVLTAGAGATPKINDVVDLKYRGTLIDGTEFSHDDHLQANLVAQMKGWQEAVPLMKVGSKWRIFLPPGLAYGRNWLRKVGPESTVIFDIELAGIEPPSVQAEGPHVIPQ